MATQLITENEAQKRKALNLKQLEEMGEICKSYVQSGNEISISLSNRYSVSIYIQKKLPETNFVPSHIQYRDAINPALKSLHDKLAQYCQDSNLIMQHVTQRRTIISTPKTGAQE